MGSYDRGQGDRGQGPRAHRCLAIEQTSRRNDGHEANHNRSGPYGTLAQASHLAKDRRGHRHTSERSADNIPGNASSRRELHSIQDNQDAPLRDVQGAPRLSTPRQQHRATRQDPEDCLLQVRKCLVRDLVRELRALRTHHQEPARSKLLLLHPARDTRPLRMVRRRFRTCFLQKIMLRRLSCRPQQWAVR